MTSRHYCCTLYALGLSSTHISHTIYLELNVKDKWLVFSVMCRLCFRCNSNHPCLTGVQWRENITPCSSVTSHVHNFTDGHRECLYAALVRSLSRTDRYQATLGNVQVSRLDVISMCNATSTYQNQIKSFIRYGSNTCLIHTITIKYKYYLDIKNIKLNLQVHWD